jgi:hypothetical protein
MISTTSARTSMCAISSHPTKSASVRCTPEAQRVSHRLGYWNQEAHTLALCPIHLIHPFIQSVLCMFFHISSRFNTQKSTKKQILLRNSTHLSLVFTCAHDSEPGELRVASFYNTTVTTSTRPHLVSTLPFDPTAGTLLTRSPCSTSASPTRATRCTPYGSASRRGSQSSSKLQRPTRVEAPFAFLLTSPGGSRRCWKTLSPPLRAFPASTVILSCDPRALCSCTQASHNARCSCIFLCDPRALWSCTRQASHNARCSCTPASHDGRARTLSLYLLSSPLHQY